MIRISFLIGPGGLIRPSKVLDASSLKMRQLDASKGRKDRILVRASQSVPNEQLAKGGS